MSNSGEPPTGNTVPFSEMSGNVQPSDDKGLQYAQTTPAPQRPPGSASDPTLKDARRDAEPGLPPEVVEAARNPKNIVSKYVLVKMLGKGGMGTVWKAFDRSLARWAAIKFLQLTDDDNVKRFEREAKLAANLRHPNIAPVYEVGQTETQHYIAMEYIDGASLERLKLPLNELLDLFAKVCAGVEAAHKAGIVHRDLKPQNVMVTKDGWPYVMDFGLAKALATESSLSVSGAIMGTPAYMPPEQAEGKLDQIDARSDVYALGATLYALLVQRQPFSGQSAMEILMKVCREEPAPPRALKPELPAAVEAIILKAMAKAKDARYASAAALAEDIKRYLAGQTVVAPPPAPPRRSATPVILALVGVVALALAGIVAWTRLRSAAAPPVVPGPGPTAPVESPEAAWEKEWEAIARELEFAAWKRDDKELGKRVRALIERMPEASGRAVVEPLQIVLGGPHSEIEELEKDRSRWIARRGTVEKIDDWCAVIIEGFGDSPTLKSAAEHAEQIRGRAKAILAWRGTFTLRIVVGPWARVESLTRDSRVIDIPERHTPLVLDALEIGTYEVVLSNPTAGRRTVKIEGPLENGRTYQITGQMSGEPKFSGPLP